MEFAHKPVLLEETLKLLAPERGGIFVDGTLGGGGHAKEMLARLSSGRLIGIDRDADALKASLERLGSNPAFTAIKGNFSDMANLLDSLGIDGVDGILFDLGVSSFQLDNAARGFSYNADAPLDMRMDASQALSALDIVNTYSEAELCRVISRYGEERWASRIAKFIVAERKASPIETTGKLNEIIKRAIPASARREGPHPSKRTYQALRIETNDELDSLEGAIRSAAARLNSKGRMAVITFHSLEDRIVKQTFRALEAPCVCPAKSPICVCGLTPTVKVLTRKAVAPTEEEVATNPRSRSAHVRAVEKL